MAESEAGKPAADCAGIAGASPAAARSAEPLVCDSSADPLHLPTLVRAGEVGEWLKPAVC